MDHPVVLFNYSKMCDSHSFLYSQSESSLLSLQEKQRREVEERRIKEGKARQQQQQQQQQQQRERDRRERESRTKVEPGFPSPLFQNRCVTFLEILV